MSLFKKCPKRFFGTQLWKLASPTPIETSFGKKFAIVRLKSLDYPPPPPPPLPPRESNSQQQKTGLCPTCRSPLTLSEDLAGRRGLVSRLMTVCTNAECTYQIIMSTPQESKTLNARSVLAMRSIGRGRASMESFFAMMDMLPPVQPTAFHLHKKALGTASEKAALNDMLAASAYLHALHGAEPTEVVDIAVTCDGT